MAEFQLYPDSAGKWRWRLIASNGTKIASSGESFYSRENAQRSAELVKHYAGSARIVG